MKTGPFLDRAGMGRRWPPVAVVDELHKRLEEQLANVWKTKSIGVCSPQGMLVQTLEGELCWALREAAETLGRTEERKGAWKRMWIARQALQAPLPPLYKCDSIVVVPVL